MSDHIHPGPKTIEPRPAVRGNVDRESLLGQSARHKAGYLLFVLDQQNAHDVSGPASILRFA